MAGEDLKSYFDALKASCDNDGRHIEICGFEEAYPGIYGSGSMIQISGDWIATVPCDDAMEYLYSKLWEIVPPEDRSKFYSIDLYDEDGNPYCESP